MSDTPTPAPAPVATSTSDGRTTSEYRLTVIAMTIGTILDGAAAVLHGLQDGGVSAPWFSIALAVLGTVTQVAALFGYQKSRTLLKAEAIRADPS